MLWIVLTTGKCNLKCDYCGGSFPAKYVPYDVKYDLAKLKSLIERDERATVIFYGGEPLQNPRFIMRFMDSVRARRYGIQTNGTLYRLLPEAYWRRMDVALISVDGREEITDKHRGKGVYRKAVEAAKYVKSLGVETIARMAVTQDSDIYEEVTHLLSLGVFDKVHWQLDVVWSEEWDFASWAWNSYLPGVRRLYDLFLSELKRGKVIKVVPFLGVISAHYFGGFKGVACGAGVESVAVNTDGRILSCPIAVRESWAVLGTVDKGFRLLEDPYPERCKSCEFLKYCGGRCLYAQMENYWSEKAFEEVDNVTKEYLRIVLSGIPVIDELIREGVIRKEDLYYDPTEDSTEVIP